MAYSIKPITCSRTGLESQARFWKEHKSISINSKDLNESGIPLDVRGNEVAISKSENHCMICGVSGRGKTRRELYPTVIMAARAKRSIVIADMKGEIFRNTAEEVKRCGHEVKVINLRNPQDSDRFSPLALVKYYWDSGDHSRATILLKDICTIVTEKIHSDRDMFWEVAAQDAIAGFGLLLLEKGNPLTFENIHSLFNEYFRSKDDRTLFNSAFDTNAESYKRLSTIINIEADNTLSCIVSEVNASLSPLVDQKSVRDLLSGSEIDLKNIGDKPTAIYIVCPDESTSLHGIASLFVEQCYSELVAYADSRDDNRLPVNVDFVLDEFGSFVGSNWPGKLTAARSRGIRFILAIQAMSQIVERYGENGARTIMSNCRTLTFMGGRDIRLINEISMLSGTQIDDRTGIERSVLSINELSTLKTGEIVVLDDSGLPYIGHVPDWEIWGIKNKTGSLEVNHNRTETEPVNLKTLLGISEENDQEIDDYEPEIESRSEQQKGSVMTIKDILKGIEDNSDFVEYLNEIAEKNRTNDDEESQ